MMIGRLLPAGLVLALLIASSPAFSADEATESKSDAPSPVQLKGSVIQVDVQLNNLSDARLDISRARKAIANLYDEVTRQQMTMNYTPNMVGSMVIMTPTPTFSGQYLPARKEWVDESMADIVPIIKLFKQEVDTTIENNRIVDASETTRKQLAPLRDQAFASVKQSSDTLVQLERLTSSRPYDNKMIAQVSQFLDKQMKDLDKSLKRAVSILQKEARSRKS